MRNDTDDNLYEVERLRLTAEFFQRATRLSLTERDAFLEAEVPDPRMREDVRELLEARSGQRDGADEETPTFHDRRKAFAAQFARPSEEVGIPRTIGPYRIVRRLGSGSAGTVYEAEEDRPRRSVALKVLHPEMVSVEGLRRFEREANSLARVLHRGIAQIYAFGQTADDDNPQPYIAMELVRGQRLIEHADTHKLGLRARIALFLRVCDAVQHAHQQGILHRDLKPSNIIVTEEGRPKVLDFSVACDTEPAPGADSPRMLVGTLAYMSPEQALGDPTDVDTRTDVYALGVIGYQLLSGHLPLALDDLPVPDAVRTVTEVSPAPLGDRARELRGDLTWIFGKALAKSKDERYDSVATLASDLRRFLRRDPVHARPATAMYLLGRFVERYRTLVGSAALILTAMIAAIVLALRARDSALHYQAIAEAKTAEAERAAYSASLQVAADHADAHEERAARRILDQLSPEVAPWEWRHVKARVESDLQHFPLPQDDEVLAGRSRNRRWVADVRNGREVRVLDVERRHLSPGPNGPTPKATAIAIDDTGTRLYWCAKGALYVHDTQWRLMRRFEGQCHRIALAVGTGGILMAVSQPDDRWTVEMVDATTGKVRWSWDAKKQVDRMALDFKGERLAVGESGGRVALLDVASGREHWARTIHLGQVTALKFTPDGSSIASGSTDRTIRFLRAANGEQLSEIELDRTQMPDLDFSADGTRMVSAEPEGVILYWDLSGADPREIRRSASIGESPSQCRIEHLLWNERARAVVAVSSDGMRLHEIDTVPNKPVLRGHRGRAEGNPHPYLTSVDFDPRGGAVASAGWDGTVRIWDTATNRVRHVLEHGKDAIVRHCMYLQGGARIVSISRTGYRSRATVRLWDTATGRAVESWTAPGRVESMAYSPRTNSLVLLHKDVIIRLEASTLQERDTSQVIPGKLNAVACSPDGARIFAGNDEGTCYLIRASDLRPIRSWKGHQGGVHAAQFDAKGRKLATVSGGQGSLRVWDVATGRLAFEHLADIDLYAVRWSPDGSRIFTGSRHPAITVHDSSDGKPLLSLRGHRGYVLDLALAPDGAILASASGDNTVRLWHTHSAEVRGARMRRALAESER